MSVAWVGAGIAAVGVGSQIASSRSQSKAASNAASSADAQAQLSYDAAIYQTDKQAEAAAAQLEFAKQQYSDWQATYGGIQNNLASYYQGLSADAIAAEGVEAFDKEYNNSITQMNEMWAQRGVDPSSGLAMSMKADAELNAAETRASIRANADDAVAAAQSQFLGMGLGVNPAGSVTQAYNAQAAAAGNSANLFASLGNAASNQSYAWTQAANQAQSNMWSGIGQGLGALTYAAYSAYNQPSTTVTTSMSPATITNY